MSPRRTVLPCAGTLALLLSCLLIAGAGPAQAERPPAVDLETATVAQLQDLMRSGELTSVELIEASVDRIEALNRRGPGLNAVRKLNPAAFAEARARDIERRRGRVRGPLHGIPVLVKDNLDAFGMPTTAGSVALERSYPREDSTVVAKLRAAGAVLLGKTNLTEFANFFAAAAPPGMPAGYSSLGGQVLNAYDTDASPGGSSSGSGTAVAAGLAAITIGTETSGSIISPASAQGIVGLRPTVGLVSRTGILPISATQDTAGPMTRTVADAAAELQAIAGRDPEDPATADAPATVPDYLGALDEDALAGTKIGVITSNDAGYNAAKAAIAAAGATPVQLTLTPPNVASILTYEFKRDLNAYLDRLPSWAPIQSLQDILDFADAHPLEMKKFGYERADEAQDIDLGDPATYEQYVTERDEGRAAVRSFIDMTLDRGTADPADDLAAIMTPAGTLTGVGARAGYPQLTVPAGYTATQQRPMNISFNGAAYSEETLLALGYAYERATKLQRPPSVINPALYRCADTTPPSVYGAHSCAPGLELLKRVGREPRLPFSLEQTSIDDLQRRMARGTLSATTLTKAYLARIARTNTAGPSINAVRIVNRHALDDARALGRERARGRVRGPMHGIPVLVKDNIDVRGMPTTAGALALENSYPRDDAPIVKTLRRAGAIILGKTNLSEFANFYSSSSISGYSAVGGQVLTPIDLDQNPSGSSSGSAAAASAGLAAATIGTETSGSIVSPSARHGIVGLRPTVGLVPRTGIVPISASQDTAGPMTQTVYDAAAELQAIAGKDAEDPATDTQPAVLPDYLAGLEADALAGTRIGVVTSNDVVYRAAVAAVQAAGAVTVQIPTPTASAGPSILTLEFERDLNAYFARLPADAPIKSLTEVIAFNNAHPGEAVKLGMDILIEAEAIDLTDPATHQAYVTARDNGRAVTRAAIDSALTRGTDDPADDLAAIMTPAGTLTGLGARAGYPQLTVPAGYDAATRNPVNISFNGTRYSEPALLALGYAFEHATRARRPPSETNPASWRCVPGGATPPRSCPPGDPPPRAQRTSVARR